MFKPPANLKFKKYHKIKLTRLDLERRLFYPKFGDYGLQAITSGKLNGQQLEAGRIILRRMSQKQIFLKINVFPFLPFTKKPTSARMGKGKGKVYGWVVPVRKGKIVFEISAVNSHFKDNSLFNMLRLVNQKLSLKSRPVKLIY